MCAHTQRELLTSLREMLPSLSGVAHRQDALAARAAFPSTRCVRAPRAFHYLTGWGAPVRRAIVSLSGGVCARTPAHSTTLQADVCPHPRNRQPFRTTVSLSGGFVRAPRAFNHTSGGCVPAPRAMWIPCTGVCTIQCCCVEVRKHLGGSSNASRSCGNASLRAPDVYTRIRGGAADTCNV